MLGYPVADTIISTQLSGIALFWVNWIDLAVQRALHTGWPQRSRAFPWPSNEYLELAKPGSWLALWRKESVQRPDFLSGDSL